MCYKSRGPTVISHWSQNESCALCRSYPGQLRSSRGQAIWKSVAKNLDFFSLLIEDGVLRTQLGLQVLTSELKTCGQPAYICYLFNIEISWKLHFLGVLFHLLYVICLGTLIGTVYPRPFFLADKFRLGKTFPQNL